MANFVTEDDKRIFDLQPIGTGESISDYQLVLDKTGNSEAKRITIPNFINRLFPNLPKQRALSGNNNPDNASGTNGDFYYKVNDTSLTMYEKVSGSWSQVFIFSIPEPTQTTLRRTFIIPAGTSAPSGVISLVGLTNEQGDQVIPDKSLWAIYDGGRSGGQQYVRMNSEVQGLETDENELTVNEVLVVLDGVESEINNLTITNTTDRVIIYDVNNTGVKNLNIGEKIPVNIGDSIILSLQSESSFPFFLGNNNIYEIPNQDGGTLIELTPHEWIIPEGTTILYINTVG